MRRLAVAAVLLLPAGPAFAHAVIEGVGGFPGGFLHPLLVPAHLMALTALGLLVGRRPDRAGPLLAFATALAAGLVAIALAVGETAAPDVLLAATAVLGLLLAAGWRPPSPAAWLLAALVGAALALDSPPQAVTIAEGNLMLLGTAIGAGALLLAVVAVASALRPGWQQIGARVVGSWIAASAILVLALSLR